MSTSTPHPFDKAIALQHSDLRAGHFTGTTSPDYWNMVGPFGGTTAAVALQAVFAALLGRFRGRRQNADDTAGFGDGADQVVAQVTGTAGEGAALRVRRHDRLRRYLEGVPAGLVRGV